MDELDLLTKLRAEVPLAVPSPRAEQLFRAGLAETQSSERTRYEVTRLRYGVRRCPAAFARSETVRTARRVCVALP